MFPITNRIWGWRRFCCKRSFMSYYALLCIYDKALYSNKRKKTSFQVAHGPVSRVISHHFCRIKYLDMYAVLRSWVHYNFVIRIRKNGEISLVKTNFFSKYNVAKSRRMTSYLSPRGYRALSVYSSRFITFLENDRLSAGVRFVRRVAATH